MQKLIGRIAPLVVAILLARPAPAHADFGLGLFLGEPTGVDFKIGMGNRSGLDLLFGFDTFRSGRGTYGHVTYLVTPLVGQGSSVLVPLRIGIGAALYGTSDDIDFAVRAPVEIALRLRSSPVEFYGELAALLTLFDPDADALQLDLQAGVGLRLYF